MILPLQQYNITALLLLVIMLSLPSNYEASPLSPPTPTDDDTSCKLMDSFAIVIQFCLVITGILTLLYKRSIESPKRSMQIWILDVSKQFIGAAMIHFINIAISSSAADDVNSLNSNECVWYFLNLVIDTTIGVFMLWVWFIVLLSLFKKLDFFMMDITGEYGPSPLSSRLKSWSRQLLVFLLAEVLAKACLYGILVNSPLLFYIGELCLSLISDQRLQVVFVMLIFPIVMNAVQFYLTDVILKVQGQKSLLQKVDQEEQVETKKASHFCCSSSLYFTTPMIAVIVEQTERTPLLFPPSKHKI